MTESILDQEGWIAKFQTLRPWVGYAGIDLRTTIWFNPVNHHSMRLTKQGWVYLTNSLQIEKHTFKLSEAIRPKTLLQLERYIQYPYYVHTLKEISIFDESTAVMLILNSNNLQKYLDDLEKHQ